MPLLLPADRKLPAEDLGPLLDRIDLQIEVPLVQFRELSSTTGGGESSATIRARVDTARKIQSERFRKSSNATNSTMSPRQVKQFCILDSESSGYLEHAMEELNFSDGRITGV